MTSRPLFFIALLPILPLITACSEDPAPKNGTGGAGGTGGGQCTTPDCPFNYSTFNRTAPVISLRTQLLANPTDQNPAGGILRRACAFSSCHDETPEAFLFLGPALRNSSDQAVIPLTDAHVTRLLSNDPNGDGIFRTAETTGMPIVDPGRPENSFLMHKIDGCFTGLTCTPLGDGPPPCGERMPASTTTPLCNDERDIIRRWIAQGARDTP